MIELDETFTADLQKSSEKGGWTYVVMPGSAEYFGTRGLVKVRGTVDGRRQFQPWPLWMGRAAVPGRPCQRTC